MKNNEPNPNIKPKFITITQHHQQNPIAQIHQPSEREFGSDRWCVVAELVNSDHGAIVEREKLRLERDSVHRGWRERERDRDRESVEIILKSND